MFPSHTAGLGLILLRACVALQLILLLLVLPNEDTSVIKYFLGAVLTLGVCLGAGTPVVSIACFFLQLNEMRPISGLESCALFVPLALPWVLFLLGPGAYSIDARRYGRRIISIRNP